MESLFTDLFGVMDTILTEYMNGAVERAAAYIKTPVKVLGTVSFVAFGLVMLWGKVEIPLREFVAKGGVLAVVLVIGGSAANYNTYIANHLLAFPNELLGLFSGEDGATVGETLDQISKRAMKGIGGVWQSDGWLTPALLAGILFGTYLFFAANAAMAVGLMKIGLTLVVAMGPLLLVGLLHRATREFVTRALSYALQFAVLGGLIGGVSGIADAVTSQFLGALDDVGDSLNLVQFAAPAVVLLLLGLIFRQLPSMASSITGGIGLGIDHITGRAVGRAAGAAGGAAAAGGALLARQIAAAIRASSGGGSVEPGGSGGGGTVSRGISRPPVLPGGARASAPRAPKPEPRLNRPSRTREEELERIRRRDREEEEARHRNNQ